MTQIGSIRRLHYGWIVVAVAGVAVLIGAGVRSAPGIFLLAMEEDIGISRIVRFACRLARADLLRPGRAFCRAASSTGSVPAGLQRSAC